MIGRRGPPGKFKGRSRATLKTPSGIKRNKGQKLTTRTKERNKRQKLTIGTKNKREKQRIY